MSMINCPECKNLISDRATVCPRCGCPISANNTQQQFVDGYRIPPQNNPINAQHTSMYSQIKVFSDEVKTLYVLGILSIVLCLGIGIIFEIIYMIKYKNVNRPDRSQIHDPYELGEFDASAKKLDTSRKLWTIAWIITGIALFALFMGIMISIQM